VAARGFQAAVRTGAQLPWGDASDLQGDELSARYGWQVPLVVDVGFKLQKPIFLGLYAGAGYGQVGSGSEADAACRAPGVSCRVLSYQLGVQGQYHFGPSDRINPWLGAGFGYELARQSLSAASHSEEQQSSGVTLLKLGFGIDYRSSFGFGPFVEVSAGRYEATRTEIEGVKVHEGPVDPSAWHGFLMLGARLVVMP
jgi:opacity protein-like surface antigen